MVLHGDDFDDGCGLNFYASCVQLFGASDSSGLGGLGRICKLTMLERISIYCSNVYPCIVEDLNTLLDDTSIRVAYINLDK
jgi:hypothetical protein